MQNDAFPFLFPSFFVINHAWSLLGVTGNSSDNVFECVHCEAQARIVQVIEYTVQGVFVAVPAFQLVFYTLGFWAW